MRVRDEIAAAVSQLGVRAVELAAAETSDLEAQIECAFARPGLDPLWERLLDKESIHDPDGWKRIAEFVRGPAVLFVRDSQGSCAFRFDVPNEIVDALGASYGFVFYIVDLEYRYLLCFNDHDVLIGCGAARSWVRSLRGASLG